jgi:hypothetical protein
MKVYEVTVTLTYEVEAETEDEALRLIEDEDVAPYGAETEVHEAGEAA